MSKYHYVYRSFEEGGRDYLGRRTCDCLPQEDTKYFGSFKDKTFSPTKKTILFVCETREEAAEIEIKLHDFFDVAVNPQFANKAKATSTKFDVTGVSKTEEQKKAQSERMSEKHKKAYSERMSGENNPNYGIPKTEDWKKAQSEKMSGRYLGALSPCSKAIIAIKPDGTELHFGGIGESARELRIDRGSLCKYLKTGNSPRWGKFEGCRFVYENP